MNRWSFFMVLAIGLIGCNPEPADDYNNFLERTAEERANACLEGAPQTGINGDLTRSDGWLVRALLSGGITIGLRVVFSPHKDGDTPDGTRLEVRIWLDDQPKDAEPLVVTETIIRKDGTYTLVANPLNLPPEVLNAETSVIADVTLDSAQIDEQTWCGIATGSVVSPLMLDLEGSTFSAKPFVDGLDIDQIPFACPGACVDSMESKGTDMMGGMPMTLEKPDAPQLTLETNERADLTGDWLMAATLELISINLWVSLNYRESIDGSAASVDGAIRLTDDALDSQPRAVFTAPVDEKGVFEVWVPGFALEVNGTEIAADILLVAGTTDEGWCGVAAGEVRKPIELELENSTFRAYRWMPGSPVEDNLMTTCP